MRHELDVVAVVAADLGEVVGEILAAREMLLEAGEAAAERMPARIDDLRVRQHQVDEPDVREVVRHLVDEERRRRFALDARLREIPLAERAQLVRGELLERARIGGAVRARGARADHARQHRDVGQLHGAFDLRVRGEDLLDERASPSAAIPPRRSDRAPRSPSPRAPRRTRA